MKWKNIETAPKKIVYTDGKSQYGKWILVSGARYFGVTTARWWQWAGEGEKTNGWIMQCGNNAGNPTHWQPLPKEAL